MSNEKEILISAGFWRPSKVVDIITGALLELNERAKRRGDTSKIIWGRGIFSYRKKHKQNEDNMRKLNIPSSSEVPFLDIETMDAHKALFGVFHVKSMIVDRKLVLLTSANMQDKANVELMVHMEGKVVDSFYDLFVRMWGKTFEPPLPLFSATAPLSSGFVVEPSPLYGPHTIHSHHMPVPIVLANRLPGSSIGHRKWDTPQNVAFLSAMYNATKKLFIETPDFNERLAYKGVIDACNRGIEVTIVISWLYNYRREKLPLQGGTNVHVMKRLYKQLEKTGNYRNLTVCFYVASDQFNPTKLHNNHTKFMAIDDEIAILGSGNMDTQSWQHSQEVNVVVDSPLLVKEWLDLFKFSQNTHLYGVINPHLLTPPLQQMEVMLSKLHTQPKKETSIIIPSQENSNGNLNQPGFCQAPAAQQ